jgi:hypothetical protein
MLLKWLAKETDANALWGLSEFLRGCYVADPQMDKAIKDAEERLPKPPPPAPAPDLPPPPGVS